MPLKINGNTIAVAVAAFGMIGWLIALAGVGASQSKCTDLSGIIFCGKLLQSHWWAVWFNFFLLVAVFIMAVIQKLATHKLTMMALFTACVTLTMNGATAFLSSGSSSQQDAAAAGFVLLSMTNFLMIIIMGSFMNTDAAGDGAVEVTFKKQVASPSGMAPPPPATEAV